MGKSYRNCVFCAVADGKVCCSLSFVSSSCQWCNPSIALIKQSLKERVTMRTRSRNWGFILYRK